LSSGRLFVAINAKTYLRYSDDNGVSWNSVKSLGNAHVLEYVISTPSDELFVVAQDGNFYSKDAGQTWTSLGVQAFNTLTITGMVYTHSGKLLVSTRFSPLYISADKGTTWTTVPANALKNPHSTGSGDSEFGSPAEDLAGSLYLVGQEDETLFQSKDSGKTWAAVNSDEMDFSFYIDQNNWFYKMVANGAPAGIYISKDQGATYSMLIPPPGGFIENMTVQSDGNFYFDGMGVGLYQAVTNSTTPKVIFSDTFSAFVPYIVAKNNGILVSDRYLGLVHYYTK
ncbi:MAG TPA: hypothetical protein VK671_10705, partial [Mucilaginibacter sp.]|nr:hypothetical protein [Mucilaginibacter sp.]